MQPITPHLWFDKNAEDAVRFYVNIFPNSHILATSYYGKTGQEVHRMQPGSVMTIQFELNGQTFVALNGGPLFRFTEAVSFVIPCDTQAEIDHYWEHLREGGDKSAQQCGWLKDQFGLSWQIVPSRIGEWLQDSARAERIMAKLLEMKKLDLGLLERA